MFCSSKGSMATLLQQKNCMTTLSNGTVSGSGSNGGNNSTTEKSDSILNHHDVTIPSTEIISSSTTVSGISTSNGGSMQQSTTSNNINYFTSQSTLATIYNSQQQQNQNSDLFQNFDSNFIHNQNHHVQSFSTRYFSQFNNQETEFLNMSSSTEPNHNLNSSSFGINSSTSTNRTLSPHSATPLAYAINKQNSVFRQEPPISSQNLNASNQKYKEEEILKENTSGKDQIKNMNQTQFVSNNDIDGDSGTQQQQGIEEPEPEIDIVINNVVCSFSVRCHLNLREIALNGFNVEFRRENGMVTMKLRRPYTTASIWSSGRITCTGATSEEQAKIAARRYARCLQKLGFSVRFHNFRVVNVLGTCSMPWAIKIVNFSEKYKNDASYEPELHPGVTYKLKYPKATLKIFSTGSITVTAGSVAHVQAAIEHIFPLVYEFRKKRSKEELDTLRTKQVTEELVNEDDDVLHSPSSKKRKRPPGCAENDPDEDIMNVSDYENDDDQIDAE